MIAPTCDRNDVGEAWVAYQWVRHLAERHEVTLLTYHKRGAEPVSAQLPSVRVIEWREPPLLGRAERLNAIVKPGYLPFYARARSWIKAALAAGEQFDVVHQPAPVAMRYPSPAVGLGLPVVIGPVGGGLQTPPGFDEDQGSAPWFMRLRDLDGLRMRRDPLLRRTYQQAACVVGIAPYVRENLRDVDVRRFEVLSETALEDVPDAISRVGRTGALRLLYVGRLVRTKGVRDLVRAMADLQDLPVRLDVVGDGPELGDLQAMVREAGLSDRVTLHGRVARTEVDAFYRAADVFVFPSFREAGGNVALEAMGHSLPLIVVDRGGPGAAVNDDCAIRLEAIDPEQLSADIAAAVRELAGDPARRLRMGEAAHRHVSKTATWDARSNQMSEILWSVCR